MRRYSRIKRLPGKKGLGTDITAPIIRTLVRENRLPCKVRLLTAGERLDQIADRELGDASLWWVIAAASEIGWGLQVPPGTVVRIPIDLTLLESLIG